MDERSTVLVDVVYCYRWSSVVCQNFSLVYPACHKSKIEQFVIIFSYSINLLLLFLTQSVNLLLEKMICCTYIVRCHMYSVHILCIHSATLFRSNMPFYRPVLASKNAKKNESVLDVHNCWMLIICSC